MPAPIPPAILQTFVDELDERVGDMEKDLLALERSDSADGHSAEVRALFRAAHSLKGAARAIGIPEVEAVCHELESRLAPLRDEAGSPDRALVDLLLISRDALADAGLRLREGRSLEGSPIADILRSIRTGRVPTRAPTTRPMAPVTPARPSTQSAQPASQVEPAPRTEHDAVVRLRASALDRLITHSGAVFVQRHHLAANIRALDEVSVVVSEWQRARRAERLRTGTWSPDDVAIDARLAEIATLNGERAGEIRDAARDLEQASVVFEDELRVARMQTFGQVCEGFERALRDLTRDRDKDARLIIEGADVEVDRAVGTRAREALLHLLRNAFDHGIEPTAQRIATGKSPQGTVRISATVVGSRVSLSVSDDGRGLDESAIKARASEIGMPVPTDRAGVVRAVTAPGFSTRRLVSEISGRGVGLDVVVAIAEELQGTFELDWTTKKGSRCALIVPLTLATMRAVVVRAGTATFALPTIDVRRILRLGPDCVRAVEGKEMVLLEDRPVRIVRLAQVLGLASDGASVSESLLTAVLVGVAAGEVALIVDATLGEQELVVRGLGRGLADLPLVTGATVLESGEVAPILSMSALVRAALSAPHSAIAGHTVASQAPRRVLVVDDSATTRSLLRSILEASGYNVLTAVDGVEALTQVRRAPPDAIVSDVDMPRMNGFELCAAVRSAPSLRPIPFVLVTTLGSDADRARGMEAGADAYIVKSDFAQGTLLDALGRLLP